MGKGGNFFDALSESLSSATRFGNIMRRVLYFLLFGFLLGFTTLIKNLDLVGQSGGGVRGVFRALFLSVRHGLGVGHTTVWTVIRDFGQYLQSDFWGSIVVSMLFLLLLVGFWFQPLSLLINILDGQGRKDSGDRYGNATSGFLRFVLVLVLVLIFSMVVFYKFPNDSLVSSLDDVLVDVDGVVVNGTFVNGSLDDGVNDSLNDSFVDGVIDLSGGGGVGS